MSGPDVTPKTESGRAYLAKLGPETGIGSHNIRRDAILAIEQEAASKAVAEERERLLGNLREFLKIHGDPIPWSDVEAVFA